MSNEAVKSNKQSVEKIGNNPTYLPAVDILEHKDRLVVIADMPGIENDSVNINFEDGVLNIKAKVQPLNVDGYKALYTEYQTGDYQRSFSVPDEINIEKISAAVNHGVLTITLPKSDKPQARKIPVQIGK